MADKYKKLTPGDRIRGIPADLWNDLVDMANEFSATKSLSQQGIGTSDGDPLRILNTTDEVLERYSIVGIGDPIAVPSSSVVEFLNRKGFEYAAPASGSPCAILQESIDPGTIGNAMMVGVTQALVDMTDATHRYAGPIDDDVEKLESSDGIGVIEILWADTIPAEAREEDATLHTDTVAPEAGDGDDGDYWQDTDAEMWYGPKASGTWPAGVAFGVGVVWCKVRICCGALDGSTDCHAILDECSGVIYYQRTANGIVTNSAIPCDHCDDGSGGDDGGGDVQTPCCVEPLPSIICLHIGHIDDLDYIGLGLHLPLTDLGDLQVTLYAQQQVGGVTTWVGSAVFAGQYDADDVEVSASVTCSAVGNLSVLVTWKTKSNGFQYGMINDLDDFLANCNPFSITQPGYLVGLDNNNLQFLPSASGTTANVLLTFTGGACAPCVAPTVTLTTTNLAGNSPTITITGTGFSTTPSENIVTFDDGASGTVLASTTTSLTVSFTTQPTALGTLKASVSVNGCSSGALVQVATIINPLTGGIHIYGVGHGRSSGPGDTDISIPVTLKAGIVVVDVGGGGSVSTPNAFLNGVIMTKVVEETINSAGGVYVTQWKAVCAAGNATISVYPSPPANVNVIVRNVTGLADNTTDKTASDNGYGSGAATNADTFTDTNGTNATAHTPDTGASPTSSDSHYAIQSNKLVNATLAITGGATVSYKPLVYQASAADVTVQADITNTNCVGPTNPDIGTLIFRYVDDANMWALQLFDTRLLLFSISANAITEQGSYSMTPVNGVTYTYKVVTTGNSIKAYLDGVERISVTNSTHNTATKHGVQVTSQNTGSTTTIDNFSVASGGTTTPDTGPTLATATAAEAVLASFALGCTTKGTRTWGGSFIDGGQDEAINAGTYQYELTEGRRILSSTGTVDASLAVTGYSGLAWAGVVVTYS